MVGSRRLEGFTFTAPALPGVPIMGVSGVGLTIDSIDRNPVLWYAARACDACSQIANPQTKYEQIELNELSVRKWRRLDVEE
jgi:hypothetical protein